MKFNKNIKINFKRICVLDELRGIAVIMMVIYHMFYSMTFIFHIKAVYPIMYAVYPYEPVIPTIFITLSGIVSSFSRSNLKRGIKIFTIAIIITIVTYIFMPSEAIIFGILHFLGIALILYSFSEKLLEKLNVKTGAIISLILFILLYKVPRKYIGILPYPNIQLPEELYNFYILSFLGFPSSDFSSSDYFPIIPHIFLFMFGIFIGKIIKNVTLPEFMYKKWCPLLDFIGKNALIIYVVHQPIIIGILYIVQLIF